MDVSCFDLDLFESEVDSFWFLSTFVGIVNSFSYIHYGKHYAIWGRVLVIFNFHFWLIVGCSIVFLAISSSILKHLSTSFPYLCPRYNPSKSSWLSYVHCILVVENFRILASLWQIASLDWVMSEPLLYFKQMSGSDFTFPKSEVVPVILAHTHFHVLA